MTKLEFDEYLLNRPRVDDMDYFGKHRIRIIKNEDNRKQRRKFNNLFRR